MGCQARLDDPDDTKYECECPAKKSGECTAVNCTKTYCFNCYGHGRRTNLVPTYEDKTPVEFRIKTCGQDCGPCDKRRKGGIKFLWINGTIKYYSSVKPAMNDWMGGASYDITTLKPKGSEVCTQQGRPFKCVKEEDIRVPGAESPAASPIVAGSVAGGDFSQSAFNDEQKEDHGPDAPPSIDSPPTDVGGVDDALLNSTLVLARSNPDRRRLQNLIKRFQRASLQCQFGNNN